MTGPGLSVISRQRVSMNLTVTVLFLYLIRYNYDFGELRRGIKPIDNGSYDN